MMEFFPSLESRVWCYLWHHCVEKKMLSSKENRTFPIAAWLQKLSIGGIMKNGGADWSTLEYSKRKNKHMEFEIMARSWKVASWNCDWGQLWKLDAPPKETINYVSGSSSSQCCPLTCQVSLSSKPLPNVKGTTRPNRVKDLRHKI